LDCAEATDPSGSVIQEGLIQMSRLSLYKVSGLGQTARFLREHPKSERRAA
jgi:hypothetical protein